MDHLITVLEDGSERIPCISVKSSGQPILIISVYMPSRGKDDNVTEYQECVQQIQEILQKYYDHIVFIGGDFNEDLTTQSVSKRKEDLSQLMSDFKLTSIPVGPTFIQRQRPFYY